MAGEFAVIGLGAFGRTVALELVRRGRSVLAIDRDERVVQALASELDTAVCADATSEAALTELEIDQMVGAVVAIGMDSTESSILATALLRQMGVPRIIARSVSELHGRVLHAVGAHEVVNPEESMGQRLARRLAQPNVLEQLELAEGAELAEVGLPEIFVGKNLVELEVRQKHSLSVVAVRRGSHLKASLTGRERLESGDVLVVVGASDAIARFASMA